MTTATVIAAVLAEMTKNMINIFYLH
jgi:hypothetical protein